MAPNNKRLDLRFGAFACSVQGFDDPVVPVQQVLRAIQHLLEESPDIADAGISFDAETIESLVEEVSRRADVNTSDLEITPGLVIVYHGEGAAPALAAAAPAAAAPAKVPGPDVENAAARAYPSGSGTRKPDAVKAEIAYAEDDSAEDEDDEYDEFAGADPVELDAEESEGDLVSELFAARLRRSIFDGASDAETVPEAPGEAARPVEPDEDAAPAEEPEAPEVIAEAEAQPEAPRDIFAPPASTGGDIFLDPMASSGAEAEPPLDLETAGHNEASDNVFAAPQESEQDGGVPEGGVNLFGNFLTGGDYTVEPPAQDGLEDAAPLVKTEDKAELAEEDDPHSVAGLTKLAKATAVPDMMVSAAAWMVMFKGQSTFTRREVMDAFDRIPGDHQKSLEVRIKGFGKAVRNGQIVMVEDGVFGLARKELERFQGLL